MHRVQIPFRWFFWKMHYTTREYSEETDEQTAAPFTMKSKKRRGRTYSVLYVVFWPSAFEKLGADFDPPFACCLVPIPQQEILFGLPIIYDKNERGDETSGEGKQIKKRILTSSLLNGKWSIAGFRWFTHRSRTCFPTRPGNLCAKSLQRVKGSSIEFWTVSTTTASSS